MAKGEVDHVMYISLDRLQEIWQQSPAAKDFVVPWTIGACWQRWCAEVYPSEDYHSRFFFCLRQRHKKYKEMHASDAPEDF